MSTDRPKPLPAQAPAEDLKFPRLCVRRNPNCFNDEIPKSVFVSLMAIGTGATLIFTFAYAFDRNFAESKWCDCDCNWA